MHHYTKFSKEGGAVSYGPYLLHGSDKTPFIRPESTSYKTKNKIIKALDDEGVFKFSKKRGDSLEAILGCTLIEGIEAIFLTNGYRLLSYTQERQRV